MAHRGGQRLVSVARARPVRRRRALARALAATGLAALATWPLVIASPVSGASCIFKGGEVFVRAGDESVVVQQDGLAKTILANGLECTPTAPIAETTSIRVTGGTRVEIDLFDTTGATIDWGSIDWTLELGSSVPSELVLDNEGGDAGIQVAAGTSGIDLNADGNLDATYSGVGVLSVIGGPGADVISGAGNAVTGAPVPQELHLTGGLGADRLSGGREDDPLDCGLDVDWVDFSASPVAVQVDLANTTATGLGADAVIGCENVAGSALNDTLIGDAVDNVFAPGAGDDTVDGAEGADTVDYGDAARRGHGGPGRADGDRRLGNRHAREHRERRRLELRRLDHGERRRQPPRRRGRRGHHRGWRRQRHARRRHRDRPAHRRTRPRHLHPRCRRTVVRPEHRRGPRDGRDGRRPAPHGGRLVPGERARRHPAAGARRHRRRS